MSIRVPLPGLTSAMSSQAAAPASARSKNLLSTVGEWTPELLSKIEVAVSDIEETTSEFTRRRNPKNRYWRGKIWFKQDGHSSRIIRMYNREVPYVKATNYGSSYVYANLQRCVATHIADACGKKDISVDTNDPKLFGAPEQWWCTINNLDKNIGIVDKDGNFMPKDAATILQKSELGMRVNFDLIFSIRLTVTEGRDRSAADKFRIVPDCSRASIKAINQEIEPPSVETQVPVQKATKADVASQELIDAIEALTV